MARTRSSAGALAAPGCVWICVNRNQGVGEETHSCSANTAGQITRLNYIFDVAAFPLSASYRLSICSGLVAAPHTFPDINTLQIKGSSALSHQRLHTIISKVRILSACCLASKINTDNISVMFSPTYLRNEITQIEKQFGFLSGRTWWILSAASAQWLNRLQCDRPAQETAGMRQKTTKAIRKRAATVSQVQKNAQFFNTVPMLTLILAGWRRERESLPGPV